jgi:hypothetical protein
VQYAHARFAPRDAIGDGAGPIWRSIVDDQDVRVRERLEYRRDDPLDVLALVVRRQEDDVGGQRASCRNVSWIRRWSVAADDDDPGSVPS